MRVVLAGNPNAGKTTLFNALTKSNLRTGNFHGVTTTAACKKVKGVEFCDVPGAYTFNPLTMEEAEAKKAVEGADIIVNVVDALTLPAALEYTRAVIAKNKKVVIYLTKTSSLKRRGGKVNAEKLSRFFGVPVLDCPPKKLKKILLSGELPKAIGGHISLDECYLPPDYSLSKADKLFYNKYFSLAFFVFAMAATFFIAFYPKMPGALLKDLTEKLIVDIIGGAICSAIQNEAVLSLMRDGILGGAGTVLSFIPQLAVLYLILILLDESGVTSALAFCTDGLFEKVNLSGRAAFSLVSGFGCTAAAILTTRGYSTRSAQKRTIAVLAYVPCGAKLPVFLTFLSPLFENPFPVITAFYFVGLALAIIASKFLKGGAEGAISEVAPVTFPPLKPVFQRLCFLLKGFIIKVAGIVLAFCIASWTLSHFSFTFQYVEIDGSMLAAISKMLLPLFMPMGITDWRLAYAAVCGFIAKENVAATVALLMPAGAGLDISAALAMCTFILLCPACVSAFSASVKEAGLKFTLQCYAAQFFIAIVGAYAVRFIFYLL